MLSLLLFTLILSIASLLLHSFALAVHYFNFVSEGVVLHNYHSHLHTIKYYILPQNPYYYKFIASSIAYSCFIVINNTCNELVIS